MAEWNEEEFQRWYRGWAEKLGLDPNPDDPRHFYDYRAAYKAGASPSLGYERIQQRDPYQSELDYFQQNPHVAGMATDDNAVILNPHSTLTDQEKKAVLINEKARAFMRSEMGPRPDFALTQKQLEQFNGYGSEQDIRETIAGRILSGDPSVVATDEQRKWTKRNLGTPHWPSTLKADDHPDRFINGIDTRTGKPMDSSGLDLINSIFPQRWMDRAATMQQAPEIMAQVPGGNIWNPGQDIAPVLDVGKAILGYLLNPDRGRDAMYPENWAPKLAEMTRPDPFGAARRMYERPLPQGMGDVPGYLAQGLTDSIQAISDVVPGFDDLVAGAALKGAPMLGALVGRRKSNLGTIIGQEGPLTDQQRVRIGLNPRGNIEAQQAAQLRNDIEQLRMNPPQQRQMAFTQDQQAQLQSAREMQNVIDRERANLLAGKDVQSLDLPAVDVRGQTRTHGTEEQEMSSLARDYQEQRLARERAGKKSDANPQGSMNERKAQPTATDPWGAAFAAAEKKLAEIKPDPLPVDASEPWWSLKSFDSGIEVTPQMRKLQNNIDRIENKISKLQEKDSLTEAQEALLDKLEKELDDLQIKYDDLEVEPTRSGGTALGGVEPKWHEFGSDKRKEFYDADSLKKSQKGYDLWDFDNNKWRHFASEEEQQAWESEWTLPPNMSMNPGGEEKRYFRYGKPPESNRSINATENRGEMGVSVYVTPAGSGGQHFSQTEMCIQDLGGKSDGGAMGNPLLYLLASGKRWTEAQQQQSARA